MNKLLHEHTASAASVVIREVSLSGELPLFGHPDWPTRFPWLFQGITGRGADGACDLSFFGGTPSGELFRRWEAIRRITGFGRIAHAHQVHGARVLHHLNGGPEDLQVFPACATNTTEAEPAARVLAAQSTKGVLISDGADGHITQQKGLLLAVSVADCVPVSMAHESARAIALLHAGWRSVAGGILESGIQHLLEIAGGTAAELHCHFGPAICGDCYEVGPEVHAALGAPVPTRNTPIDLRALLTDRALSAGLRPDHITRSGYCTRCHNTLFFSHRAGDAGRQMSLLGLREP